MTRAPLFFAALALSACQVSPTFTGSFALDAVETRSAPAEAEQGTAVTSPGSAPDERLPTPDSAPSSSGGGGSSPSFGPTRSSGTVLDGMGNPLAGVTITGAGGALSSGADGTFTFSYQGTAPVLRASLPGYTEQSAGPPYAFTLVPRAVALGEPFTLTGTIDRPLADVIVRYVDADGTRRSARTDATGAFSIQVEPLGTGPLGAVAAFTEQALPGLPRFFVAQAASHLVGAAAVTDPSAPLSIALANETGSISLQPDVPGTLSPGEVRTSLRTPEGLDIPLAAGNVAFPASLPTYDVPGYVQCITMVALPAAGEGESVVERVGPDPGETWAPTFPAIPLVERDGTAVRVRWDQPIKGSAFALYPPFQLSPTWRAVSTTDAVTLPEAPASDTLVVEAWNISDVPLPSGKAAPLADNRHASAQLILP